MGEAGVASLAVAGVQGQVPAAVGGAISSELCGHQGRLLQQVGDRLEFLPDRIGSDRIRSDQIHLRGAPPCRCYRRKMSVQKRLVSPAQQCRRFHALLQLEFAHVCTPCCGGFDGSYSSITWRFCVSTLFALLFLRVRPSSLPTFTVYLGPFFLFLSVVPLGMYLRVPAGATNRYLVKNNLLAPVFALFRENRGRDNLINSAVIELVEVCIRACTYARGTLDFVPLYGER